MSNLVRIALGLTVIAFVSQMVVLAGAKAIQGQQDDDDLFAPYEAIMPGKSIDSVKDYPCQLHVGTVNGIEAGFCQFEVEDRIFNRVTVVDSNHTIARISFYVLPDGLRLGDLILCWGKPSVITQGWPGLSPSFDMVYWGHQISASASAHAHNSERDYFLPITYLSIEHEWLPCGSVE